MEAYNRLAPRTATPSRAGAHFGEFRFVVSFCERANPLSHFPPKSRAANQRFAAILFFGQEAPRYPKLWIQDTASGASPGPSCLT